MNYPYLGHLYPKFIRKETRLYELKDFIPTIILGIGLFILLCFGFAHAQEVNLDIVIKIESTWNGNAVNRYSRATGLGQITPIALRDFNQLNGTRYTMQDLKDPQRNMRISYWTLNERIPQLLRNFKKAVTLENILASYNWGINNFRKFGMKKAPKETVDYIKKYVRLAKEKR
jgi:hypothetical protein